MDAYVVRTPRKIQESTAADSRVNSSKASFKRPHKGQRRLNDLRGVVVLENINLAVEKLISQGVGAEEKLEILKELKVKQPSTEIIVKSGIGKVVQKLSKESPDLQVAKAARQVKIRWQNLLERRVELSVNKPEVITDLETRQTRDKAIELLSQKYKEQEETIVELEKKLFHHFRPLIGQAYRRCVRILVNESSKFQKDIESKDIDSVICQVTKRKS